jgi:XTP/dITP diphosphohydrolase
MRIEAKMARIDTLIYLTGNEIKFKVAAQVLRASGISLERKHLPTPEIQSSRVEEVAEYSAIWASQHLNLPVVVTDAGFYIEALNGFPGPFKFVNEWFSADDYVHLMHGKDNRRIEVRDCLAYCQPQQKPVTFCGIYRGELATKPGKRSGTPMEQIFVPEGYSVPISEFPQDEMLTYWSGVSIWQELKLHLEAEL